MKLGTLWRMLGGWRTPSTVRAVRMLTETQRAAWLAAASKFGVLRTLADGPVGFDVLADATLQVAEHRDGLRAWLRQGELLGHVKEHSGTYRLAGALARRAASDDAFAALLEGMISVHSEGLFRSVQRWTNGDTLRIADVDASTVARIGMGLAPLIQEIIEAAGLQIDVRRQLIPGDPYMLLVGRARAALTP